MQSNGDNKIDQWVQRLNYNLTAYVKLLLSECDNGGIKRVAYQLKSNSSEYCSVTCKKIIVTLIAMKLI